MTISLASIISFTALVFYTVLLIINFRQDFRSRINLTFGLYLFTMIVWEESRAVEHLTPTLAGVGRETEDH